VVSSMALPLLVVETPSPCCPESPVPVVDTAFVVGESLWGRGSVLVLQLRDFEVRKLLELLWKRRL
jgi:hypothetical protein